MHALLLVALATIAAPPPPAFPDKVMAEYFAGDMQHLPQIAISTAGSASTSIYLASWSLTDTRVSTALAMAATNGRSVNVALDLTGGTNTAQHQVARALTAAGATVYDVSIPHLIANNFLEIDGAFTLKGNYYWNSTAIQTGSYVLAISGTATAADSVTTFESLIGEEHMLRRTRDLPNRPYTCLSYRGSRSFEDGGSTTDGPRENDDACPPPDFSPIARIPEPRPDDDGTRTTTGRRSAKSDGTPTRTPRCPGAPPR